MQIKYIFIPLVQMNTVNMLTDHNLSDWLTDTDVLYTDESDYSGLGFFQ